MSGEVYWPDGIARGELIYWDGNETRRIKAGSAGYVLMWVGGAPVWVPQSSIDHGSLSGLLDDDHLQHPLLSGPVSRNQFNYLTGGASDMVVGIGPSSAPGTDGINVGYFGSFIGPGKSGVNVHAGTPANAGFVVAVNAVLQASVDALGVNSVAGFRYNGTAPAGQYLRGNGTQFVPGTIQVADLPVLDHGALTGLTDDDHTQYLRSDGTRVGINASHFVQQFKSSSAGSAGAALQLTARNAGVDNSWYISSRGGLEAPFNRLAFYNNGVIEVLRINGDAIENKSYSVKVGAGAGTTQLIAPATLSTLTWPVEAYDTGSMHDTAVNPSRLTAPVTGRYHVSCGVRWLPEALSTVTYFELRMAKNGVGIVGGVTSSPPHASIGVMGQYQSVDADIDLTAGQYVEAQVYFDAGAANRTIDKAASGFSMYYIGGL